MVKTTRLLRHYDTQPSLRQATRHTYRCLRRHATGEMSVTAAVGMRRRHTLTLRAANRMARYRHRHDYAMAYALRV